MMYKITIDEVYEVDGKDYPKTVEIYKQNIPNLNIPEVVKFLNKGEIAYPQVPSPSRTGTGNTPWEPPYTITC